jgi:ATP-dependent protease ClpP protease subunit
LASLPVSAADVRLLGAVDEAMLRDFNTQLSSARQAGAPIVIELMTSGGDADTARRIALEIQLVQETEHREVYFLGKTLVYSAGMTIMASVPVDRRFAARDTVFLLHERRLTQNVHLPGPTTANLQIVRELLSQLECGRKLELEGYAALIKGSSMTIDEVAARASTNWYLDAREALAHGLIAGIT